ncbi:MAG: deoxyhypusine hydroxylase [Trizodia sp. TS-e1964]|nr:MAG: deoxyhypusine hydroxylase [Trizodia sp. TS-e1964]
MAQIEEEDATVRALREVLSSEAQPLARRFRALFSLKHVACQTPTSDQTLPAIKAIAEGFESSSALLKHELAYCLGQTKNKAAIPYLKHVLQNRDEDPMCRHEAAEALGAIGDMACLDMLKGFRDDKSEPVVVTETCTANSNFASIDPAPPLAHTAGNRPISEYQSILLDTSLPLFQRYRAMFALRDLSSPPDLETAIPAVKALATGLNDPSALFRHEIAFVFGQLSHPASIPSLAATLANKLEASMVRHEAAEALGSLGDEEGVEEILRGFLDDEEQVVRDSVIVALDMAEFEKNGEREYALLPKEESRTMCAQIA